MPSFGKMVAVFAQIVLTLLAVEYHHPPFTFSVGIILPLSTREIVLLPPMVSVDGKGKNVLPTNVPDQLVPLPKCVLMDELETNTDAKHANAIVNLFATLLVLF